MLIAFAGKSRSGKSTASRILLNRGYDYMTSFAAKLKKVLQDVYGLSYNQLHDQDLKAKVDSRWNKSPRELAEEVGDKMRQVHPESWIRSLYVDFSVDFTVDDVRYENEVKFIRQLGGFVVRIEREGSGAIGGIEGHPSDNSLDNRLDLFDGLIENNGSLDEFYSKVIAMDQHLREVKKLRDSGFAESDFISGSPPQVP